VNHRKLLVKLTLNMPKINARADLRIDKAIVALTKYPNMTIPEAMKLADFTPLEILCKAKYMWVYWRAEKIFNWSKAFLTPPTTRCVEVVSGVSMSTLSESVTSPPSPSPVVASPPNKVKRIAGRKLLPKPVTPKSFTRSNNTMKHSNMQQLHTRGRRQRGKAVCQPGW
jgi:hypothetical protein